MPVAADQSHGRRRRFPPYLPQEIEASSLSPPPPALSLSLLARPPAWSLISGGAVVRQVQVLLAARLAFVINWDCVTLR